VWRLRPQFQVIEDLLDHRPIQTGSDHLQLTLKPSAVNDGRPP